MRKQSDELYALSWLVVAIGCWAGDARADGATATLRLASPSFVSFQNEATQGIPSGAAIRFRLGERAADGSMPFVIEPGDVEIPEFPIGRESRGKYELVATTSGVMRRGPNGLELTFPARIRATTISAEGAPRSLEYDLVFTTAGATAKNAAGTKTVNPRGKPVNEQDGTVELVVATTNHKDAGVLPGAATFAYLVGRFDIVPGKTTPVKRSP
jgi:hypothetical protein